MTATSDQSVETRAPLTRDRVLAAAIDLADEHGIEAMTMRRLGHELGVEAMSLYNHIANKDDLLNGVVETVVADINLRVAELEVPDGPSEWKSAVRSRILVARSVLLAHPWMPGVLETRTEVMPVIMSYYDGLIGLLRLGGFSFDLIHHAMHALGSRALGFTQELFDPDDDDGGEMSAAMIEQMSAVFPHMGEMLSVVAHDPEESSLGWCDDQTEFIFGLDLILDGLERHHTTTH